MDAAAASYFTYSQQDPTVISRFFMDVSGQVRQLMWVPQERSVAVWHPQERRRRRRRRLLSDAISAEESVVCASVGLSRLQVVLLEEL
jgi:hypothetical protein